MLLPNAALMFRIGLSEADKRYNTYKKLRNLLGKYIILKSELDEDR